MGRGDRSRSSVESRRADAANPGRINRPGDRRIARVRHRRRELLSLRWIQRCRCRCDAHRDWNGHINADTARQVTGDAVFLDQNRVCPSHRQICWLQVIVSSPFPRRDRIAARIEQRYSLPGQQIVGDLNGCLLARSSAKRQARSLSRCHHRHGVWRIADRDRADDIRRYISEREAHATGKRAPWVQNDRIGPGRGKSKHSNWGAFIYRAVQSASIRVQNGEGTIASPINDPGYVDALPCSSRKRPVGILTRSSDISGDRLASHGDRAGEVLRHIVDGKRRGPRVRVPRQERERVRAGLSQGSRIDIERIY